MAVMGVVVVNQQISRGINHIEEHPGVHVIVTLSGRYIKTKRNEYKHLCAKNKPTVLISREKEEIHDVTLNLNIPDTKSAEYDDIIFLLLLDMIKHQYYQSLKK